VSLCVCSVYAKPDLFLGHLVFKTTNEYIYNVMFLTLYFGFCFENDSEYAADKCQILYYFNSCFEIQLSLKRLFNLQGFVNYEPSQFLIYLWFHYRCFISKESA
jgi:hypothetical protein